MTTAAEQLKTLYEGDLEYMLPKLEGLGSTLKAWEFAESVYTKKADSKKEEVLYQKLHAAAVNAYILASTLGHGLNPASFNFTANNIEGFQNIPLKQRIELLMSKTPSEIITDLENAWTAVAGKSTDADYVELRCRALKEKLDDATLTPLLHTLISEARAAAVQTFFTDTKLEIQNPTQRPWEVAKMIAYQSGDDSPEADLLIRTAGRVKALYELLDFSRAGYNPAQEEAYLDSQLTAAPNVSVREALEDATVATKGEYRYQRYTRGHHKPNEDANPKTNNIPEIIGYLKGKKPSEIVTEFAEALNIYKNEYPLVFIDKARKNQSQCSVDFTHTLPAVVAALKDTLGNDELVAPLLENIIAEDRAQRPEFKINADTANRMMMSQPHGLGLEKATYDECDAALQIIRESAYPKARKLCINKNYPEKITFYTTDFSPEHSSQVDAEYMLIALGEHVSDENLRALLVDYSEWEGTTAELARAINGLAKEIDRKNGIQSHEEGSLLGAISKIQPPLKTTRASMTM
jgi:hypothetical protein